MQAPQTITISDADFEQTEKLLRQMGERAKTDARSWHQTEWTAEKLEAQGFGRINSPTILVREDGKRIATVMYGTTSFKAEGRLSRYRPRTRCRWRAVRWPRLARWRLARTAASCVQ